MNDERELLNAKLGELLHQAFVRIRNCTLDSLPEGFDPRSEINDLADLLHNIPRFMVGNDEFAIQTQQQFRDAVVRHVHKFFPNCDPTRHRYLQILDMNEWDFHARFAGQPREWPEPAAVPA